MIAPHLIRYLALAGLCSGIVLSIALAAAVIAGALVGLHDLMMGE